MAKDEIYGHLFLVIIMLVVFFFVKITDPYSKNNTPTRGTVNMAMASPDRPRIDENGRKIIYSDEIFFAREKYDTGYTPPDYPY